MTESTIPLARVLPGAVVAAALVLGFGATVRLVPAINSAEQPASTALNGLRVGFLGAATTAVYDGLEPLFAVVITVVLAAIVWAVTRRLISGLALGVIVAVTWLPTAVIKAVVSRARPDAAELPHPFTPAPVDASYPSGHVAFVTAVVMAFVLLASRQSSRIVALVVGALVVAVVGLAALVDGVHFPTDVFASAIWSVGVAPLVWWLWRRAAVSVLARRA